MAGPGNTDGLTLALRFHRRVARTAVALGVAMGLVVATTAGASGGTDAAALPAILKRVAERVEQYFARAQSLVCLETVRVQPLGAGLSSEGFGRSVESELRMSWDPLTVAASPPEARLLRQVLKVNGHPPRHDDPNNCTVPERFSTETPPLSMLLPREQQDYQFSLDGTDRVDRRAAIVIEYREKARPSVDVQPIEGNEHCVSFSLEGGLHGRIWIDAQTYDVLRIDHRLIGKVDIPMPRAVARRSAGPDAWTLERWDTSIRFKPMVFQDPEETLTLPVSVSSLRITSGSGAPRVRMTTEYSGYKRFLTGARVVTP